MVVRKQCVPKSVKRQLLCNAVWKLLPPKWVWAEWLVVSQQKPRRNVVDLARRLKQQRRLLPQFKRQRPRDTVQLAHKKVS